MEFYTRARNIAEIQNEFPEICETLARTRPTAVDLFWAIERMTRKFSAASANGNLEAVRAAMVAEARSVHTEKRALDEAMGRFGAELMPEDGGVMTHATPARSRLRESAQRSA